ncbi:MAG: DNA adenine methylase [Bacillota bacterium]
MTTERYPWLQVIRYMGSKLALVDFIAPVLESLAGGQGIADLMAGSHAIGFALKPYLAIFANDVQHYSYVVGKALLDDPGDPVDGRALAFAIRDQLAAPTRGFFESTYADTYLSRSQCREVDAIRRAAGAVPEPGRYRCLAALLYAMCYCQSTPGHFAQFLPAHHPRVQTLRALSIQEAFWNKLGELEQIKPGHPANSVHCRPVEDLVLPPHVGVAYLDPPYSSEQYSRFYHLLETAVLYDDPRVQHKAGYRTGRFRSDFCYPARVEGAFRRVLSRLPPGVRVAVSYSDRGLLPVDTLVSLVRERYRRVEVLSHRHRHSSLGKGTSGVREYLVVGSEEML